MLMLMLMFLREAIFNSLDSFFDKINIECGGELKGDLDLMVVDETEPGLGRFGFHLFWCTIPLKHHNFTLTPSTAFNMARTLLKPDL